MAYPIAGYDYTWWRGDLLPALPPLAGFHTERSYDSQLLANLHNLDVQTIEARIQAGNHSYVAFVQATPVAYGWSATQTAGIIEATLEWNLSPDDRHLWDFVTLEGWRGQGIYPRLLQAILHAEASEARRFWIGHRADNSASRRGIMKAGFQLCGVVVMTAAGHLKTVPRGNRERALASPMGQHLGFIDLADEDMIFYDFRRGI